MDKVKKNKSSVFILPMILGIPYKYFKGFINCYIGSNYDEEDSRRMYVVFETKELIPDKVKGRTEILMNSNQYVDSIVVDEFTVLIYKNVEVFDNDFDAFKDGRYTEFSDRYKKLLKRLYPTITRIHSIISPSLTDRLELSKKVGSSLPDNCEIFDSPYESDENFSLAHFLSVDV
jgi:hypothetical protein